MQWTDGDPNQFHVEKYDEKPSSQEQSKTFVLGNEDHTLGNALRHVIMQDSRTSFCGYSIPHPSEPILHIRVQTTGDPATKVLGSGLGNLAAVCEHMNECLEKELQELEAEAAT